MSGPAPALDAHETDPFGPMEASTPVEFETSGTKNEFDEYPANWTFSSPPPQLTKSAKILKIVLLAANMIFLIFGCVLVGVGSVALNSRVGVMSGLTLPTGIIVLGVFIMLLSFLGCFGAWRENRVFLGVYFALLALLTLLLLIVGIAVYVERNNASKYMIEGWRSSNNDVKVIVQLEFQCCGLMSYNDVEKGDPCPDNLPSKEGCLDSLKGSFRNNFTQLGAVGISFAVLMIVFLIFAGLLMKGIQRKKFDEDIASIKAVAGLNPGNTNSPVVQ